MQVEVGKAYLTEDGNAVALFYKVGGSSLSYPKHIYKCVLIGLNERSEISFDNNATYTEEGMFRKVPSCLDLIGEATLEAIGKAMQKYIKHYNARAGEHELELFYKVWKDK